MELLERKLGRSRRTRRDRSRVRSPRVLIVVQNLPVPLDRRVWLESKALVAAGYGVSVICPRPDGDLAHEVLEGVHIHRYRAPRTSQGLFGYAVEFILCWLQAARLSVRVARREGFDILQACNPPDTYWLLGLGWKLAGKKFVFDHHDLCPEIYDARVGAPAAWVKQVLLRLERASFRVADAVISTNHSYRRIAITRGGCPPSKVTIVRSGPNTERLRPTTPLPELRRGADHLCVYLGIMGPQDGVEVVVRAAEIAIHEMGRTDCHFALLGFGDCLEELRALTSELQLDAHVTFTGRADDDLIRSYLSTADVGLSPDPKTPFNDQSTMNKTLEYMAFGLPVLAFDLHETRVSAGAAAVYVEEPGATAFAKALCALLDDPTKRAEMAAEGSRLVRESLAWPLQATTYVKVYDQLTGGASRGHDE